jgi:hypothetical protein
LFNDGESPESNDTRRERVSIGRVLNVEVKRWPTPNTFDTLPPRSAESLHHEQTVRRPGRTQAANLRDAVTGNWPTATVHDEKAMSPAEFNRNSPPLMAMVHLWSTILSTDGEKGGRFQRSSTGAPALSRLAAMRPSPSTPSSGGRVEDVTKLTRKGRTLYRKSGAKVTLHLETAVRPELWPTATVCGNHNRKGASATSGDGLVTAVPSHGRRWIVAGVFMPSFARRRNKKRIGKVAHRLNPRWVECLMGWPIGSASTEPMPELVWPAAYGLHPASPGPYQHNWEPPRVALPDPYRRVALKALGNGQVPQCAAVAWELLTKDILVSEVSNE